MSACRLVLVAALLAALAAPARASDPVALAGAGKEIALTLDALRALPSETIRVAYQTSKGEERARYTGARLWDVLAGNGLIDAEAHRALLRSIVAITAGDGYRLVLSAGELAPTLGEAPVLLAYEREGQPLAPDRAPRLVVPGDRRGSRQVFDVVRIEVREIEAPVPQNPPQEKTP